MSNPVKQEDNEISDIIYNTPPETLDLYSLPYIDGVIDALKWVTGEEGGKKPFSDYDEDD